MSHESVTFTELMFNKKTAPDGEPGGGNSHIVPAYFSKVIFRVWVKSLAWRR